MVWINTKDKLPEEGRTILSVCNSENEAEK